MTTTIDNAGRAIPSEAGKRMPGPKLVRHGQRLVARPQAAEGERTEIDVARLIEEERTDRLQVR